MPFALFVDQIPGAARQRLAVSGEDAVRFLQGTGSAELEAIAPEQAVPTAFLTVKGKLIVDAVATAPAPDRRDLWVPREEAAALHELLDRHVIMDEVDFELDGETALAIAWGEGSESLGGEGVARYATSYPAPGVLLTGKREAVEAALEGAERVTAQDFERHRLRSGTPAWGKEVVPDRFPPEVGFTAAVSYDKGCFMGQEPLARLHARGRTNWVLVRVAGAVGSPALPLELSAEERDKAGRLTSWLDGEGLAVVHRSLAAPGTPLHAEGERFEVRSEALGDDPGTRAG